MVNKIPEICRDILNVEIEEAFKIKIDGFTLDKKYYITKNGTLCKLPVTGKDTPVEELNLTDLLSGYADIVKLPWKPKHDEEFYTFDFAGAEKHLEVIKSWWRDFDAKYLALCKQGWVFRTKESAEKALPSVVNKLKKEGLYGE